MKAILPLASVTVWGHRAKHPVCGGVACPQRAGADVRSLGSVTRMQLRGVGVRVGVRVMMA
jgi:hypothetical protein